MGAPTKGCYKDPVLCYTAYYCTMQPMNVHIEFLTYKERKKNSEPPTLSSSTVTT